MGRRDLLSADERRRIFGVPTQRDDLARFYTFEAVDLELIEMRREGRNRLGFAVQLALLRHPGLTLAQVNALPDADLSPLTAFVGGQLQIPADVFESYGARDQTRLTMPARSPSRSGCAPPSAPTYPC